MYNTNSRSHLFILAGNGPYDNRGCEAIVRGTVKILRHYFVDPEFVLASQYKTRMQYEFQDANEHDARISHYPVYITQRFTLAWFKKHLRKHVYDVFHLPQSSLVTAEWGARITKCSAVLSVGGDNYSLDYGLPTMYIDLDNYVMSKKKPIIIWGASVGPFNKFPVYEQSIVEHLKRVNGIFARESATVKYLDGEGVTKNVYQVADPGFLMEAIQPSEETFKAEIPKGAIGINLSPLMARYVTNGDLRVWIQHAANIVKELSRKTKRPIYLIPHVTNPYSNDYELLKNILSLLCKTCERIELIPPNLTAAETKWVVSKMAVFAGARTHSTIAAISSGVPTLSFAYSIKAKGINEDIFGDTRYCILPDKIIPQFIAERIDGLIRESDTIKYQLNAVLPGIKTSAMNAGKYLKEIIDVS